MGNTKYITFQGDVYRGEEEFFSEQSLLEVAHGDHVGVKMYHCYLHWNGEPEVGRSKEYSYVIGHLTTHSMSGFTVVGHIVQHMRLGHIEQIDVDWADHFWLDVEDRRIVNKIELVEAKGVRPV